MKIVVTPSVEKGHLKVVTKIIPGNQDPFKSMLAGLESSRVLCEAVLDLQDKAIRAALIELGWTPPKDIER